VAPSALSANSTDARGARTTLSAARAASLAALARSRSDFYGDLNNSASAAASSSAGLYAAGQYQWIRPVGSKTSGAK
jgi:hypothetical protein